MAIAKAVANMRDKQNIKGPAFITRDGDAIDSCLKRMQAKHRNVVI